MTPLISDIGRNTIDIDIDNDIAKNTPVGLLRLPSSFVFARDLASFGIGAERKSELNRKRKSERKWICSE